MTVQCKVKKIKDFFLHVRRPRLIVIIEYIFLLLKLFVRICTQGLLVACGPISSTNLFDVYFANMSSSISPSSSETFTANWTESQSKRQKQVKKKNNVFL